MRGIYVIQSKSEYVLPEQDNGNKVASILATREISWRMKVDVHSTTYNCLSSVFDF